MRIENLNFLVVQADAFQRNWLNMLLCNLGATNIVDAPDGQSALALLLDSSQQIDIGFVDLHVPGMDGMELIRHMAKTDIDTAIIMSGIDDPALEFSVVTLSKAYGVNLLGFLHKPIVEEMLDMLIRRYTPSSRHKRLVGADLPRFSIDELLLGLANDQFNPYFQPKVELATGQVRGAEAFARWNHPDYGMIMPDQFIPVLEQNQQLDQLTTCMIDKSVAACRHWHDAGYPISVSINLGGAIRSDPIIADLIAGQVATHRLDAGFVNFDITESATTNTDPESFENIVRLRMKGFALSVDDYATGNTTASMQQLLRIPFSELKIDRSFVAGAAENEALGMVLTSSLELATRLEKSSVAVGIESRQDWNLMKKMGCTFGQGFYIAKPMEASALPDWMREWAIFF